jgi:hypothetical protein
MADHVVLDAVAGLQTLIEADGGAFELVDDGTDRVLHVRLVMDAVTCAECILPPDMLRQVADDYVRRIAPGITRVEVDDPRVGSGT